MHKILVVDDEKTIRDTLAQVLSESGYEAATAPDGVQAVKYLTEHQPDIAILDLRVPGLGGMEVLQRARQVSPDTQIIIITAFGTIETAVEAMRLGASDYIMKPFVFEDIMYKVGRLIRMKRLATENLLLKNELSERYRFDGIVGSSKQLKDVLSTVEKLAQTYSTALITGESGTGKELIARAIHYGGVTAENRLVAINCAALSENLVESELFGHKRGAFSGADADKPGIFELADGGTIFLDEIGSMPMPIQAKLLRAIEHKSFMPLGGTKTIEFQARIICATNADLKTEVQNGNFREDLYYRLSVIEINVPPLRDRREDIPALIDFYLDKFKSEFNNKCEGIAKEAVTAMMAYSWPGNIRELKNVIERAVIFANERMIQPGDLAFVSKESLEDLGPQSDLQSGLRAYEKQHIIGALISNNYDKAATARSLNLGLSSLYRKIEQLGIKTKAE